MKPQILNLVVDHDLRVAREAAANIATRQGYPMLSRGYIAGEWDGDSEVLTALEAIRLATALQSIPQGAGPVKAAPSDR